jgi:protein TonB
MFEQAVLEGSYGTRRAFATGAGFAGQAALAAFLVIAPMIWPQVLPRPQLTMSITPPKAAPPEHIVTVKPQASHSAAPIFRSDLLIPSRMPSKPQPIVDVAEPPGSAVAIGVPGGVDGMVGSALLDSLLHEVDAIPRPAAKGPEPKAAVEAVKRIRVSSLDPGRLIHMVQPIYPSIAKSAHISGTVELRALIGTDGRVRELSVVSGHPLLRNAALDAVRQWIYKPPSLGGESVEIVAPIAVIFRLN